MKIVRKVMADGSVKEYRYPPRAERDKRAAEAHAIHMLALAYYDSPEFKKLSPRWQSTTRYYVGLIEDELGWMTLPDLNDRAARDEFYALRDAHADYPAKADKLMDVLRRLLAWGYERNRITINHAVKIPHLVSSNAPRADFVWTDEWEAAFLAVARPEMANLFRVALFTGLRQSDLCGLRWSDFDGQWLVVKPSKTQHSTGVSVHYPVHAFPPLADLLADLPRSSEYILTTDHYAQPWRPENLKKRWRETMAAAGSDLGSSGLRFHDIRGTTVTRLYDAGCTDAEVASVTGHAIGGGSMLRAYAARTRTLALNAYRRWWSAMQGGAVVNFGKKFPVSQKEGV